jgi:hypothetical protein
VKTCVIDDSFVILAGIAIFVIVFLNAGIAAFTENMANSALEALKKMSQAVRLAEDMTQM